MRPQVVEAAIEDTLGSEVRFERHRADHIGRPREPLRAQNPQRGDAGHDLRTVDQRQTFFWTKGNRSQPSPLERGRAGKPLAAIERFALADQRERHMCERREIAARADRSLTWHDGCYAAFEHCCDEIERLQLHAGVSGRE